MSCGSSQFGDGAVVDFASAQKGLPRQVAPHAGGGYEDFGGHPDDYGYDEQPEQISQVVGTPVGAPYSAGSTYDMIEEHGPQAVKDSYAMVDPAETYEGDDFYGDEDEDDFAGGEAYEPKNFLIPFEISIKPSAMEAEYACWKLSQTYPKPFRIPNNKELGDEAVLAGIDVYSVVHDFPTDIALQVSMKGNEVDEKERDNPESYKGEILQGPMGLGSYKTMPVHSRVFPNSKPQEFCVLGTASDYRRSFLENVNSALIKKGKPAWTEAMLRNKGVVAGKRGNFLVERDQPVMSYISSRMEAEFEEAGTDHYNVSRKTFNRAVNMIMSEAAQNIKMGDARKNLRIFAMRLVAAKGRMAESSWQDERGLFDKITADTPEAQEKAKKRILNKTYSIKGNLCLNYIPIGGQM